ncbi:hypothetical protein niasHT_035990 [Heterodera trifolii]|uniref:DNA2/NAM7 helicase-like C-terminal domain-containing protein n=1 Tax=Heterodera trifolii TaxID=157864 RepID=A0ABD2I4D4_9BILA
MDDNALTSDASSSSVESPAGTIYESFEALSIDSSKAAASPEGSANVGAEIVIEGTESNENPAGSGYDEVRNEGSSVTFKAKEVALDQVEVDGFANNGFDDEEPEACPPAKDVSKSSLLYLVSQAGDGYVIACKKSPKSKPNWPFFMNIEDKLIESAPGFQRKLEVGDFVAVSSFEWNQKLRYLAEHRQDATPSCKFWFNENSQLLPKQADATGVVQLLYMNIGRKQITGVVYWIKRKVQSIPSSFVHANIACCGLAVSARINRRHLDGINPEDLKLGSLVTVVVANIPQDSLVSMGYILPDASPYKLGTERRAETPEFFGAIASVRPHLLVWPNLNANMTPKVYPCSAELTKQHVVAMEHVVGAALQIEMEREVDMMIEARFEGRARKFDGADCLIVFGSRSKKEVNELAKVWEPESQVKVFKELGEKHFALGVVKDVEVLHAEYEKLELHIVIVLNNIQERKNVDIARKVDEFIQGGTVVIHPVPATAVEDRLFCFRCNVPSIIADEDSPRGRIMAVLLGRPAIEGIRMEKESVDDSTDSWMEEEGPLHPAILALNSRQRVTARLMLGGGLIQQQAPPGTGKTKVAAAIIKAMMDSNPGFRIVVMACANIPVAKLVQEAEGTCAENDLDGARAIALFSGFARCKYTDQIREVRRHTLPNKVNSEEFVKQLSPNVQKQVKEYLAHCEKNPRLAPERAIGKVFNSCMAPKIVFSTAVMAANLLHGEGNITDADVLLFDESTQAQWAVVVHLVARMPQLKAFLLTGDRHQLGVHLQELPDIFHSGYGLESVILQAEASVGTNYTFLTKMYRSHPFLAKLISYASYELHNEQLIPARSAEERSLITGSGFLMPVQECPVGLINAFSSFRVDPKSDSLTDDHQTEVASFLVQALLEHFGNDFSSRIIVLCMYTYQTSEIERKLKHCGVRALTVDAYQAQECDVIIIVTTRSKYSEMGSGRTDNMHFFEDDQRATVALSRARHAVFIIGDLVSISAGQVWKRFIEMAITRTSVVRAEYVLALLGRTLVRSSTCLFDSAKRESVEDEGFLESWALKHGLRLDRTNAFGQQQSQQPRAPSFQFQNRHFPALQTTGPSDQAGPSGSGGQQRGAPTLAPQYGRGQGRRGPDNQWMHYGGNPKRQKGGRR